MAEPTVTVEEFVRRYPQPWPTRVLVRCECGDPICLGWAWTHWGSIQPYETPVDAATLRILDAELHDIVAHYGIMISDIEALAAELRRRGIARVHFPSGTDIAKAISPHDPYDVPAQDAAQRVLALLVTTIHEESP